MGNEKEITLEQLLSHSDMGLAIQVLYYDSRKLLPIKRNGNITEDLLEGNWTEFQTIMSKMWHDIGGLPIDRDTDYHPCYWASEHYDSIHKLLEDALALGFVDQVMRVSGVLRRHGYDHHAQVRRPTRKRR